MIDVDEARRRILAAAVRSPGVESVPLAEALGRVIAEPIASDVDSPPYDKSLVDGYAIVAADLQTGSAELEVLEEVTAGQLPTRPVVAGTATRIMTGAPMPDGADAVVMIEQSEIRDGRPPRVRLADKPPTSGQNILRHGTSLRQGDEVLRSGHRVRPIEVGLMAEVGCHQVPVRRRPTVGVLSTGDELVAVDQRPQAGQIRNSNGPMLQAAARDAGAEPVDLGSVGDQVEQLRERIAAGLQCDVLLLSGGVSAGVLDLVPPTLEQLGVQKCFHKVRLKPGKPLWFGTTADNRLVFGLPGNPVSSLVCFQLFVVPALEAVVGAKPRPTGVQHVRLAVSHRQRGDRPTYFPAVVVAGDDGPTVRPLAWQGSADQRTLADANALAYFPPGDHTFAAGELIQILPFP